LIKAGILAALLAGIFSGGLRAEELSIQWMGQSSFLVRTPDGVRVLMDPVGAATGYEPSPQEADVVTISHEHADHTNTALAKGAFSVLRGLAPGGKDWNRAELEIGDVRIFNVASYHDSEKGAQRGLNSIFVLELPDTKLVHLGDLGHLLDEGQIQSLKGADILLVPVGGFFTIDAKEAEQVVNQIEPKYVVIPMHYKTPALKIEKLASAEAFLKGKNVSKIEGNTYRFDTAKPPVKRTYIVLNYR
jgi:L-ascorbate metabolism protein UlaG (beta-lactamase superfamily)